MLVMNEGREEDFQGELSQFNLVNQFGVVEQKDLCSR